MDEIIYVRKCLKLIEEKLGWMERSTWVYDDFRRLQEMIFEASGTNLSVHTLERLFGKLKTHKNYNPQRETKNALAIFLGFKNWKHFQSENPLKPETHPKEDANTLQDEQPVKPSAVKQKIKKHASSKATKIIIIIIGFITVALGFIITQTGSGTSSRVKLKAENLYGSRPHTVKFNFNLTNVDARDISFDFGIGRSIHNIPKNQDHLYKTYLSPGIFDVRLKGDGVILDSTQVFIGMDQWKGYTYTTYDNQETMKPLPDSLIVMQGSLYTPPQIISTIFPEDQHFFIEYLKVYDFKVNGDNMTFETRFRNNHDFNLQICYDSWFKLIGTKGVLKMHFLKSGCAGFVQMNFGEKHFNGHKQDLSAFTREFSDWKKARMEVHDKRVKIYFEDNLIFTTSYSQSVGDILGLSITTKGCGQTDYVKFYDEEGKLVYSEDFSQ